MQGRESSAQASSGPRADDGWLERWLPLPELARSALGLVLSSILALAMHKYVELPSARLRKRFGARRHGAAPSTQEVTAKPAAGALSQKSS